MPREAPGPWRRMRVWTAGPGRDAGQFSAAAGYRPARGLVAAGLDGGRRGIAAVFTVLCFVPGLALILGAFLPVPAVPDENTAPGTNTPDPRSRRALADRRGTPRSLLPGRSRGR